MLSLTFFSEMRLVLRFSVRTWLWCQELSSNWDGRPFEHNRHGPKIEGGCAPIFWGGRSWSLSNTMSPGPRPAAVPSGIL